MRTGLIAKKIGMTSIYNEEGSVVPITLLSIDDCQVVCINDRDGDEFASLQIGAGSVKLKNVSKSLKGHFAKNNVSPKYKLVEFKVQKSDILPVGTSLLPNHFVEGQFVDVVGISIGKGFAGWIKRWGFHGLRASHGVSLTHRSGGSTGQRQDPGRVMKGKKMPGQMGSKRITAQNLRVVLIDLDRNLIGVKGAVPGHKGNYVLIKDAVKKALPKNAPRPTFVQG